MKYNVIINLNVDYNDSALGVRNALQKILKNAEDMSVKLRSTEVYQIEDDVIKFKGEKYAITAWLCLLPTDLLKEILENRSELSKRCYSHARSLAEAISGCFEFEKSKRGLKFWEEFCDVQAPKIEDEHFAKIGGQDLAYFISKLSEPFKTEGLAYLTKKNLNNKLCKNMSSAIIAIDWTSNPNLKIYQWVELHSFYSELEDEVTPVIFED